MQVEEIFIWGKKTKEKLANFATRWLLLIVPSRVANQNAGFALVHWLGDTNDSYSAANRIGIYYIHTEIYTLKSRRVNFRSQTDVNQSNVAYRFSHMWEKRYVQSGAAYHVFSRVSRTASWRFHSRPVGAVSCTSHRFASLKRANSFYSHFFHR